MGRVYDLEERTKKFAVACRQLVGKISMDVGNKEDGKQLVRSSGSVAANYIEANEALSRKDFILGSRFVRKRPRKVSFGLIFYILPTRNKIKNAIPCIKKAASYSKSSTQLL